MTFNPELGHLCFGQPSQRFGMPNYIEAALSLINDELGRVMWNIYQEEYDSPFLNSGNKFKCHVFEVEAYSWDDEYDQPYNFKYNDVEISWYKWFGRGGSINKKWTPLQIAKMLDDCLNYIYELEKEHIDEIAYCGFCGKRMQIVRPGKWQCVNENCEDCE